MRLRMAYSYSCLLARMPKEVADKVIAHGMSIPDERIHDDESGEMGREDKPHVTVKYGLHTTDPESVKKFLAGRPPIKMILGTSSVFYNDDYVVLKLDVRSPDLKRLNREVSDTFECTDTHPEYHPHVTIAYVKKDQMDPYWFNEYMTDDFDGMEVELDEVEFSASDGKKYKIPLDGGGDMKKVAKELLSVARELAAAEGYETLNDAAAVTGIRGLEPGSTEIWYMKPSKFRDFSFGPSFMKEHGEEADIPDPRALKKTHIHLGDIKDRNLDNIFRMMQGEKWSPRGEARPLIIGKGLRHTSMSVGDIIKVGNKVWMVDAVGFYEL